MICLTTLLSVTANADLGHAQTFGDKRRSNQMANPEPIRQYHAAVESLRAGEKDKAAESLALAIGGETPSPLIGFSVEKMLTPGTYINELILQLVASTVNRR